MQRTAIAINNVDIDAARAIYRPGHPGAIHVPNALDKEALLDVCRDAIRSTESVDYNGHFLMTGVPDEYPALRGLAQAYMRDIYNPLSTTKIGDREPGFPMRTVPDEVFIRKYGPEVTRLSTHADEACLNLIAIFTILGKGTFTTQPSMRSDDVTPYRVMPGSLILMRGQFFHAGLDKVYHGFHMDRSDKGNRYAAILRVRQNPEQI